MERSLTEMERSTNVSKTFGWLFISGIVAGLSALWAAGTPAILPIVGSIAGLLGILLVEILLIFLIFKACCSENEGLGGILLLAFSAINGATLSVVLLYLGFVKASMILLLTAGVFGAAALYGYFTKRDLTGLGGFLFMALTGLVLAGIANLFIQSSVMSLVLAYIGVLVFIGYTAHDMQQVKYGNMPPVIGALSLYLDFVNLFVDLARIFGEGDGSTTAVASSSAADAGSDWLSSLGDGIASLFSGLLDVLGNVLEVLGEFVGHVLSFLAELLGAIFSD